MDGTLYNYDQLPQYNAFGIRIFKPYSKMVYLAQSCAGKALDVFLLYTLAVFIVSMFSSLVAYTIVMLPIVTQICEELCLDRNSKFAKMMFLSTMWVILIGYIATPIGHEVPVLILGLFEVTFGIKASLTK